MNRIEGSLKITIAIVLAFFFTSIAIVLISPRYVDESWITSCCTYQVQLYEELDPHLYISNTAAGNYELQQVQQVFDGKNLFAFVETPHVKLTAPKELEEFITKDGEEPEKLTRKLLLLRKKEEGVYELYDPDKTTAFVRTFNEGNVENWSKEEEKLYVKNPFEYLIKETKTSMGKGFKYDPEGRPIKDIAELTSPPFNFHSRQELIAEGERIYAIEGCWYCHTDQTRTLVQDTVSNGSDSFPAPPSSANEYVYQSVTFPGTRRIGPDLSRVAVKRPSRDWHKSHFWAPKTQSPGSIMPSFHHFFDDDPRGTSGVAMGVPNYSFEAIYQYMMTKGTRISPPTEAWWQGKDPIHTKELIERGK